MTITDSKPQADQSLDRDAPTVVVAVVLYNSAPLLDDFIASIPAGMDGVRWQLVAADNASTDDSVDEFRRLAPEATIVRLSTNRGYAAGINAAVAAAGHFDAVLVVNPDVRLTPRCVTTLVEALETDGIGIAVPKLRDGHGELVASMRREPTLLRAFADAFVGAERAGRRHPLLGEVVTDVRQYESRTTTDWAEGSTQLISAECWRRSGPWDERFFLYSEETDFDLRARDNGLATLFVPEAEAVHLQGGSSVTPELWALLMRNRARLFRRRNGLIASLAYWSALVLRESTRALQGSEPSRAATRALLNPRRLRETPGPEAIRKSVR